MKKLFFLLMMFSTSLFAQKQVTKFMGIPVDGFKKEMIHKLEGKGFEYDRSNDCLTGEFNGEQVYVYVLTNNNRVWRIALIDKLNRNEADIKIRFNNLYDQFSNNEKYIVSLAGNTARISDDEDLSYEMTVHSKNYQAVFNQKEEQVEKDSITVVNEAKELFISKLKSKFNLSLEEYKNKSKEEGDSIFTAVSADIIYDSLMANDMRHVWFTINQRYGYYTLTLFYDNEYNKANGEDL